MRALPIHVGIVGALVAVCAVLYITDASASYPPSTESIPPATDKNGHLRTYGQGMIRFKTLGPEKWYTRYRAEKRGKHDAYTLILTLMKEQRALHRQLAVRGQSEPIMAIRFVFGRYAEQAIRVASCETGGTFDTNASNGQYLGLFQMGDYARGRYGHGPTAIEQAKYAYAYFAAAGYDWSPWECRP